MASQEDEPGRAFPIIAAGPTGLGSLKLQCIYMQNERDGPVCAGSL